MTIGFVVLPLSGVGVAILPHQRALPVLVTLEELSCVFIAVGIGEDACSRAGSISILSLVDVTILELIDATSMLYVVLPLTHIDIAVSILERATPITLVINPFAIVG